MTPFGKLVVAGVVILLAAVGAGAYYLAHRAPGPVVVACTMEAKICPDGTAVGRTGPNCEFAPCPTTATSSLNADVYPLYSGASWQAATAATTDFSTTTSRGYKITSTPSATTSDISSVTTSFTNYYDKKLKAAGWSEDISLDADGPGASQRVYKKGAGVISISFSTNFLGTQPNAPVQCPCIVSLSIFSSNTLQ